MKMKTLSSIALAVLTSLVSSAQDTLVINTDDTNGKDAMIRSAFPTTNYGDKQGLQIATWSWSGAQGFNRTLLEFDLSEVPDSLNILKVNLVLTNNPLNNNDISNGYHSHSGSASNASKLYRITEAWDESVTWNTSPEVDFSKGVIIDESESEDQTYYIDVTDFILEMYQNPNENHGFLIKQLVERPYAALMFASCEHENAESRPRLEIVYESASTVGVSEEKVVEMEVFPNPINDVINIDFEQTHETVEVKLTNLIGQQVVSRTFTKSKAIQLPIEIPAGIYILRIETGKGVVQTRKLIRQ